MFWKGSTAIEGLSGKGSCATPASGRAASAFRRLVGRQYAVGAHRPFDVLQRLLAEIGEAILHPVAHLSVGILRDADPAGLTDAFEPRGDVDAVAHQVAVALLDHVAEVDADPELDAAIRRHAGIAFAHGVLHLDRAAHRVDDAAELDQRPVSGALDHAPMMHGNRRVDQIAAQRPQPRQRAVLVCSGEPAVADDVRDQDRGDFSGPVHGRSRMRSFDRKTGICFVTNPK